MTDSKEVTVHSKSEAVTHDPEGSALITLAIEKQVPVEVLQGLVDLQNTVAERNARAAFFQAMTTFRAECPQIKKTRENTQFTVTRGGTKRPSKYAPLEEIDKTAGPIAAKYGLIWTWDTHVAEGLMHVVCRVSHVDGHSEVSTVSMPYESKAGSSPQQKYGSTQTYGMRYSLIAALGLTTADDDVDGNAPEGSGETITESQAADLEALISDVGADRTKFLRWLQVERLEDLSEQHLQTAINALEEKRKKGAGK